MVYVPAFQGQIHKLVSSFSTYRVVLLPHFVPSSSPVSGTSLVPWLDVIRHFSFTDDSGNIRRPVGASEDFSLEQSESGLSDNGINSSHEGHSIQQNLFEPISSRCLSGGKPYDQPPPHDHEFNRRSRSFSPKFDGDPGKAVDSDNTNKFSQIDLQFRRRRMAVETNRNGNQSEESFLDKFKLGFDNKRAKPSETAASSQSEEEKKSDSDQPEPPQDADEIFRKMKETGLIPNAVAMLDGLCKDGLVQEAMKLFGLMREKGTIPEIVIYTAVVEGYLKAQKVDDAERIFRKMQNNGISPNAFSYTVLIQGLYKCNRLQDALDFCVEMLEAGHSPNVATFVGLVGGFCNENGVEETQGVIKTLIEKGFTINEKAVREFLDKKAQFSPSVWEAIFGKKVPKRPF